MSPFIPSRRQNCVIGAAGRPELVRAGAVSALATARRISCCIGAICIGCSLQRCRAKRKTDAISLQQALYRRGTDEERRGGAFRDARSPRATYVIGADWHHSEIRKILFGPSVPNSPALSPGGS